MIVIGLTGPAGVGKTTAAALLGNSLGLELMGFADPIRELALAIVPRWTPWHLSRGKDVADEGLGCSPRDLMRTVGDHVRSLQWDIYIRALERRVAEAAVRERAGVVIHDVRTQLEAEWLRQCRCLDQVERSILIHLQREGVAFRADHETEQGVSAEPQDLVIRNPGTLDGLRSELLGALVDIRRKDAA